MGTLRNESYPEDACALTYFSKIMQQYQEATKLMSTFNQLEQLATRKFRVETLLKLRVGWGITVKVGLLYQIFLLDYSHPAGSFF